MHNLTREGTRHVRRLMGLGLLAAGLSMLSIPQADAQTYPNRPIKIVVGFSPGGAVDILSRVVAQKLTERIGVSVIVENKPGGTGSLASEAMTRTEPDGYTILMVTPTHLMGSAGDRSSFHPVNDLTPIIQIATVPYVVMSSKGIPAKTLAELTALFKKNPNKYNYGTTGTGGTTHLVAMEYINATDVKIVQVPYKGPGEAINALLANEIAIVIGSVSSARPFAVSGQINILAITSDKRVSSLPNVPTSAEAGTPAFKSSAWYGLLGPPKMPQPIVDRIHKEVSAVMNLPDILERLSSEGAATVNRSPRSSGTSCCRR